MKRLTAALVVLMAGVTIAEGQSSSSLHLYFNTQTSYVTLYWDPIQGAVNYSVKRTSSGYPSWDHVMPPTNQTAVWEQVATNAAYVYQVFPVDGNGNPIGSPTNAALVTTFTFTDDPIVLGSTKPKPVHITELRTFLNSARTACGLGPQTWTNGVSSGAFIRKEDISDLRTGLDGALAAIGLQPPVYVDPTLTATVKVNRDHVQQLRQRLHTIPEQVATSFSVNNRYFSPNGDGIKDTTTLTGSMAGNPYTTRVDNRWVVNIRRLTSNAIVRSVSGAGSSISFMWDGNNGSGSPQPDGDYQFELVDADGLPTPIRTALTTIDTTAPAVNIASPAMSATLSNVRQTADVTIRGTATDAHFTSWSLDETSPTSGNLGSGTAQVSSVATLGVLHTLPASGPLPNGSYTFKLSATDQAGNTGSTTVIVTVGNFTVSQSPNQLNLAAGGQQVSYTSIVPFPLTETLTIGSVRTLVNQQRAAGTYADVWDGTNDQGSLVGDSTYSYSATANEGNGAITWTQAGQFLGTTVIQFPYPTCRDGSNHLVACTMVPFDPYTNVPLRINYCNTGTSGGGTCTTPGPMFVAIKMTSSTEVTATCDGSCIYSGYQSEGAHELVWYGVPFLNQTTIGIIRRNDTFPKNMTVAYGTAPILSSLTVAPLMFNPASGTTNNKVTFSLTVTSFQSRQVSITAKFTNLTSGSLLRTVTSALGAAGTRTISWDGRGDNGAWVAPAVYEAAITVTDSAGSQTTIKPLVTVRY